MMITCYVIDDEPHAVALLSDYIRKTPGLELAGFALNPLEALQVFNTNNPPALTFLDVDMPELNGLEFAALTGKMTRIVFTTSYREYAPEAFDKDAEDYLLKPIGYGRFLKCIQKIQRTVSVAGETARDFFFVKTGIKGQFTRVKIPEIRFIENCGNYIDIHTEKEKILCYLTLAEVFACLPPDYFSRVHQSFIVNHRFIETLEHSQLKLENQYTIPVGRAFREEFRRKIDLSVLISKRG